MKLVVDALDSLTGWNGTGSVTASAVNTVDDLVAGHQSGSIVFHFPAGSLGQHITKTVGPVNVSEADTLVFHIWSRNKSGSEFRKASDCKYKLSLADGADFYIRVFPTFTHETIDISGVSSITEITFEAVHDDDDYLVVSYMVASKTDLPGDLYDGISEALGRAFNAEYPTGLVVGTATVVAGASLILVTGLNDYLWRGSVLTLDDGANQETHQIKEWTGEGLQLGPLYDGELVVNSMTAADVLLLFPAESYRLEEEAAMPGFTFFGMEPEPVPRQNDADVYVHSFTNTGMVEEKEGLIFAWPVQVDVYCRNVQLMAAAARMIRRIMADHKIYVNGVSFEFDVEIPPVEVLPSDAVDSIPNLTYTITVEVKEQAWRTARLISGMVAVTVTPVAAGQPLML